MNSKFFIIPKYYFFVSASSEGISKLNSFDNALISAGVGNYNLVKVSSILPPHCKETSVYDFSIGTILPIAYTSLSSDAQGELISSAISVGIPSETNKPGIIMEYSGYASLEKVKEMVEKMTYQALSIRNCKIKKIKIEGKSHIVDKIATTFAGVVLWS